MEGKSIRRGSKGRRPALDCERCVAVLHYNVVLLSSLIGGGRGADAIL